MAAFSFLITDAQLDQLLDDEFGISSDSKDDPTDAQLETLLQDKLLPVVKVRIVNRAKLRVAAREAG